MVAQQSSGTSRKKKIIVISIISLAVIIAAIVGGVVGSNNARSNSTPTASSNSASPSSGATSNPAIPTSTGVVAGGTATARNGSATPVVQFVNQRRFDWGVDKSIGVALGNWLLLEKWMAEDWFIATTGNEYAAWDEGGFTALLGKERAGIELKKHWDEWIKEADFEVMQRHGINTVRVPMGFWAWTPTIAEEPYLAMGGQIQQLERILGYAAARNMWVVIDMHGLEGSQNGEQHSGRNTTEPSWFGNPANQARSDITIRTIMSYIATSPYRAVISGLEVMNEPRPYTEAQYRELSDFYARSYTTIQNSPWPVPMLIHHGFIGDAPLAYWRPFVAARATTPASLVMTDHPYPGNFPIQNNTVDMLAQVCNAARTYAGYPVPVLVGEWSTYTGVFTAAWQKQFYESQAVTWANSAGGMFWSYRHLPSRLQLASNLDYSGYSFAYLVSRSSVVPLSSTSLTNTSTPANLNAYIAALRGNCGPRPANAAPFNDGTFVTRVWEGVAKQQAAISAAAGGGRMMRRIRD